ncbi:MAG: DUF3782 domain-containing protein [Candidatus Caldarchaeum sp.]
MKSLGKALAVRIKKTIFKLLKEDEEFRYAVAGLLGLEEILKRLDRHEAELVKLREDMLQGFRRHDEELASLREETNRLREEMIAGFRRHDEELAKLREETNRLREDMIQGFRRHDEELASLRQETNKLREDMILGFRRHDEELARLREDMTAGFMRHDEELAALRQETNRLREDMIAGFKRHDEEFVRLREGMARGFELMNRHLDALGARWGIMAESAFREGLRGVLERELGLVVEKWTAYDGDGYVYGYPSAVDIDVAVKDGKTILVEVKSHVRRSDINEFRRKVEFYGLKTGKPADRKVIVTPYVEEGALEAAKQLEIEVYTKV